MSMTMIVVGSDMGRIEGMHGGSAGEADELVVVADGAAALSALLERGGRVDAILVDGPTSLAVSVFSAHARGIERALEAFRGMAAVRNLSGRVLARNRRAALASRIPAALAARSAFMDRSVATEGWRVDIEEAARDASGGRSVAFTTRVPILDRARAAIGLVAISWSLDDAPLDLALDSDTSSEPLSLFVEERDAAMEPRAAMADPGIDTLDEVIDRVLAPMPDLHEEGAPIMA